MTSRDGSTFDLWGEAFIRPGPVVKGRWHYGANGTALGMLETPDEGGATELSLFVDEGGWDHPSRLRRYTLRVDGFASLRAGAAGGEVLTRPLIFDGDRLVLNVSTSALGWLRVEVQDREGRSIDGFAEDDCVEVFGDDIEHEVRWQDAPNLRRLAGTPVRLRITMRDADLYSLRFRDRGNTDERRHPRRARRAGRAVRLRRPEHPVALSPPAGDAPAREVRRQPGRRARPGRRGRRAARAEQPGRARRRAVPDVVHRPRRRCGRNLAPRARAIRSVARGPRRHLRDGHDERRRPLLRHRPHLLRRERRRLPLAKARPGDRRVPRQYPQQHLRPGARHRVDGRAVPARRAAGTALPDGDRVHRLAPPEEAAAAGDGVDHPLRRQPGRLPLDDAAGGARRGRPASRGVLSVPVPGSLPHRRPPGVAPAVPAPAAPPRPPLPRPAHHGGLAIAGRGPLAAGDLPRLLQADAVLLALPDRLGPRGGAHGRLRDALPQRLPGCVRAVAPPDRRHARAAGLSGRGGRRRPGVHPQQRRRALPRAGSRLHLPRPRPGAVVGP